jgi:hypothetical protein
MQVRYWRGNPDIFQLDHHKFMLIDEDDPTGATLFNGSANYSSRAMQYSFENVRPRPTSRSRHRPVRSAQARCSVGPIEC